MKKPFILLAKIIIILFAPNCLAQSNIDLRPAIKSPEVNKFEQYINMPVNLVSGTPQISIPIYTLEYGGMTLPLVLEYDASGIKVESIASSVGQNWTLNVGGVVSRIVKGAPDEGNLYGPMRKSRIQTKGYYLDYGLNNLNSTLNTYPLTGMPVNRYGEFNIWLNDVFQSYLDAQPDLFYFSTPEGGAKFVFNSNREIVYLENTDFIIKESFDSSNISFSWNATSPSGIKYSFGLNNVKESSVIGKVGENVTEYKTNAWFLNEIYNFSTNAKITLDHIDNNYSTILNKAPSKDTTPCVPAVQNGAQCRNGWESSEFANFAQNPYLNGPNPPDIISATGDGPNIENHILSKVISKINAGATEIIFNYSNRSDVAPINNYSGTITAKRLDEIMVTQNGICIKKFILNYTNTISNDALPSNASNQPNPNVLKTRLILNSFTELSNGITTKPYTFTYNSVPLPHKLSYSQDKWGYFNGKTSNPSLIPVYKTFQDPALFGDRSVDFSFAQAGILEKITYPTQGSINFKYEPHQSDTPTDFYYDPNPISTIASLQPQPPIEQYNDGISFNSSVFRYTLTSSQILRISSSLYFPHPAYNLSSVPYCGTQSGSSTAIEIIDNVTSSVIVRINYSELNSNNPTFKNISRYLDPSFFVYDRLYTINVYGSGPRGKCNHNISTLTAHNISPIYDVGGLRVSQITHKNDDNSVVKTLNYTYLNPKVTSNPKPIYNISYDYLNSYNQLLSYPTILSYSNVDSFKNTMLNNSANFKQGYYYSLSSGIDPLDVNFIGPDISYGQVIETDGNGKTVYNFNPYKSYFELNGYTNPNQIPAAPKFQSLLAGEKFAILQYDQNNSVKKNNQVAYNYNSNYTTTNYPVIGLNIIKNEYGFVFYPYTLNGQTKTLKTETEITTFNGQDITTTKDYEYNGAGHNQATKIKITNSSGENIETTMQYPLDLTSKPYASILIAQNRRSNPLIVSTLKNNIKISEQETVFDSFASSTGGVNLCLPKFIWVKKGNDISIPLEKKVTYNYDSSGNLIEYIPESNSTTTFVWGYNKTQPVAKIENLSFSSISPSLITEIETASGSTGTESQLLIALNNLRTNPALSNAMITTYTYKPLIGVSTSTDPKGQKTTYEYDPFNRLKWVKDHEGNILQKYCYNYKGQQVNCDVVVYSNIVTNGTYAKNNCTSGYPGSTVIYTIAAGSYSSTVSQADADAKAQADVTANGQNYANTNGTCSTVFSNVAKSGTFSSQYCQPGESPTPIIYTVPAGRYTSTTSQADADNKAQLDVNANGQNYANDYGTCSIKPGIQY